MRSHWYVCLALVACEGAASESLSASSAAIVNGELAAEGGFPAVVRSQIPEEFCTMTRIGPRHFLTAAHCMHTASARTIHVGSASPTLLGEFEEDAYLSRSMPYDHDYTNPHQRDLAVVTLSPRKRPAYGDLQLLSGIGTLGYAHSPPTDELVTLVGYGVTMPHGAPTGGGKKRFGQVRAGHEHDGYNCSAAVDPAYRFDIGHVEFLADPQGGHFSNEDGVKSGPGDSGSPVLSGDTIVGVVHGTYPSFHVQAVVGRKYCGVASNIDADFVDSIVNAPIIDGLADSGDVDPSTQAGLGTLVLIEDKPATLTLKGYKLAGADLTWSDGSPVQHNGRQESTDALGVDTVVLALETHGQPPTERFVVATRADSSITATSARAVRFDCAPGKDQRCFDVCVDVQRDKDNCGECSNACQAGEMCQAGDCLPDPFTPGGGDRSTGGSTGDPHIASFDGLQYDQQQDGEFVLARDDGGTVVQVRQERWLGSWYASANTALAVQVGEQRVGIYASSPRRVLVDGQPIEIADGFSFADGAWLSADGNLVTLTLANQDRVRITLRDGYLEVELDFAVGGGRRLAGLLGNGNGDPDDDMIDRDGSQRPPDASFANVMDFVDSWRVPAGESLFDYLPGETGSGFDQPGFPLDPSLIVDPTAPEYQAARAFCQEAGVLGEELLQLCTVDYVLSGDARFVDSYRAIVDSLTPLERQIYQCVQGEPDRPSCEACCDQAFGQGPHSPVALADATLLECLCIVPGGFCASECAGECAAPGDAAVGLACETCLAGHPFRAMCEGNPSAVACMYTEQCLYGTSCTAGCANK